MNKLFFLLLLLMSFRCPAQDTMLQVRKQAFVFTDSLIGDHFILEKKDISFPEKIESILKKLQQATIENKAWFEEYFNQHYQPGEGLPYNEKMGVTKEEYALIKDTKNLKMTLVPIGQDTIAVYRKAGLVQFATRTKPSVFNYLKLDLTNQKMLFSGDTISFSQEMNVSESPFGAWHGYQWKAESSNQTGNLKFDSLIATITEINFGKTATGRCIFYLKVKRLDRGKVMANQEILGFLRKPGE